MFEFKWPVLESHGYFFVARLTELHFWPCKLFNFATSTHIIPTLALFAPTLAATSTVKTPSAGVHFWHEEADSEEFLNRYYASEAGLDQDLGLGCFLSEESFDTRVNIEL